MHRKESINQVLFHLLSLLNNEQHNKIKLGNKIHLTNKIYFKICPYLLIKKDLSLVDCSRRSFFYILNLFHIIYLIKNISTKNSMEYINLLIIHDIAIP